MFALMLKDWKTECKESLLIIIYDNKLDQLLHKTRYKYDDCDDCTH